MSIHQRFFWFYDDKIMGLPYWEIIQKSQNLGRLGIGDLLLKMLPCSLNSGDTFMIKVIFYEEEQYAITMD